MTSKLVFENVNRGGSSFEIEYLQGDLMRQIKDLPGLVEESDSEVDNDPTDEAVSEHDDLPPLEETDEEGDGDPDDDLVSDPFPTLFGKECNQEILEQIVSRLSTLDVKFEDDLLIDKLPVGHKPIVVDIAEEVDVRFGKGVSACLASLGISYTSKILCRCGKVGCIPSDGPNLRCLGKSVNCGASECDNKFQDFVPTQVAGLVANLLAKPRLGVNMNFTIFLGALAGYPFRCHCGQLITYLDAPAKTCDFCASSGIMEFIKHMDPGPVEEGESLWKRMIKFPFEAAAKAAEGISAVGSQLHGYVMQLIAAVGKYFEAAVRHCGSGLFEGMKENFIKTMNSIGAILKSFLGSDGFLFLCVTVVTAIVVRLGIELVSNIIISLTLGLFTVMKDYGGSLFQSFVDCYSTVVEKLSPSQQPATAEGVFEKHVAGTEGAIAMIATLFCTLSSISGGLTTMKIMKALGAARGVANGMGVAKSALLWLVECLPTAFQVYLWDVMGFGTFESDDDEFKQLVVCMRECLLQLRSKPSEFLVDVEACRLFLTSHTMLTRAVTKNTHCWKHSQNVIIRAMLAEAKDFVARAQACVDRGIGRVEPVGLILQGSAGIGKTALCEVIAATLKPDVPRAARIYCKNPNEKFWSGYSHQPVLIIDDYGAVKDVTTEPILASDLIRIISPCEMAVDTPFADKGTVTCQSELVILTTNKNMNSPQSFLTDNFAFMRRFIYVTVSVRDEFKDANGLVDTAKLKALSVEQSVRFPHLIFKIHERFRPQAPNNQGAGLFHLSEVSRTFDELMTVIRATIAKKESDAELLHSLSAHVAPVQGDGAMAQELKVNIQANPLDESKKPAVDVSKFDKHMDAGASGLRKTPLLADADIKHDQPVLEYVRGTPVAVFPSGFSQPVEAQLAAPASIHDGGIAMFNYDVDFPTSDLSLKEKRDRNVRMDFTNRAEASGGEMCPVYRRKNRFPKTSGGNPMGKNARDNLKSRAWARQEALLDRIVAEKDGKVRHLDVVSHCDFSTDEDTPYARAEDDIDIVIKGEDYLSRSTKLKYVKPKTLADYTEAFKCSMVSIVLDASRAIKNHPLSTLASVIACAGTIVACIKAYKILVDSPCEPHMRTSYDTDAARRRPNVLGQRAFLPVVRHSADSTTDQAVLDSISANCGYLERAGARVGCFFVVGNVFRTVAHFFRTSETKDKWLPLGHPFSLFIRESGVMVQYKMTFTMDFVVPFQDRNGLLADWVYYNCGTKVPPKRDLTHAHIQTKDFTHRRLFEKPFMLTDSEMFAATKGIVDSVAERATLQYSSVDESNDFDVCVPVGILSDYSCQPGDCGWPVVAKVGGQYKVIGMHIGLRRRLMGSDSMSAVVTKEEINDCVTFLSAAFAVTKHSAITDVVESTPHCPLNSSYLYCGKLTWAPKGIANRTKYRPSLIAPSLEKTRVYEPAILGAAGDTRTTLTTKQILASVANRADDTLSPMPAHLVRMAGDALFESVIAQIPPIAANTLRTLSLDEALNGDGGFVDRYPTAGSPGLPSTLTRKHGVSGKHGLMSQNGSGRWYISDEPCAQRIEAYDKAFSTGEVPFYVNQLVLKDETLPRTSEGLKKTRGVKCAPFETNVLGKRYFGAMVCMLKQYHHVTPFKCGMNVFSSDWDDHIKRHKEVGDYAFDGDLSGQENIIKGEIYDELYRFTDRMYTYYGSTPTDEERRQRASYLTSLCHFYMVLGDDLFRAKFGNPSGNWLTSFIASFATGIMVGVSFFSLALRHDPLKANVYTFLSLVRMSLFGDDNVVSRSKLIPWFTGRNVSTHLLEHYGYKYTDAKKSVVFPDDKRVIECEFLKCVTRETDEFAGIRYMACIDSGPLEKVVQWISTKAGNGDPYIAICDNANTGLDLAWTSGRDRFENLRALYQRAFTASLGKAPPLHDYEFCKQRFLRKELLDENYFSDDFSFVPHMLKAPTQVGANPEDAQLSVVAGSPVPADATVTYKCTESTILGPAKRFAPMYSSGPIAAPAPPYIESVAAAFLTRTPVGTDNRPMAGALGWFAGPFAAWSGDLRFAVRCASRLSIRTDATERLSNATQVPPLVGDKLSSMAPFDFTSPSADWALIQVPCSIATKFMILPKLGGEEKYHQVSCASFAVEADALDKRDTLTIFAAAGDNFTMHFLWMVPSILVRGTASYYPHNRNYQAALPEYVQLINVAGATAFPFAQAAVLQNLASLGTVDSSGTTPNAVIYRTEVFDDTTLISLGVIASPVANRRYDMGAIRKVDCDMKNCSVRSVNIEVRPGGPTGTPLVFNLDPNSVIVRGTSYAAGSAEAAAGWYLSAIAYANPVVRSLVNGVGIGGSDVVIPAAQSGYANSPSESFITPTVATISPYLGGSVDVWDVTPGYAKAFYKTPILPFEEKHETFEFVKHMHSTSHGIGFSSIANAGGKSTDRVTNVARKEMGEEKYTFDSFAERFQLIRSLEWDDSQVQGTVLDSRTVPFDCIGRSTADIWDKSIYWAGDVELKVQVQSTAFVCGKLVVVFAPFCDPARAGLLQLSSLVSISVAPNVSLMAGNTTEVSMMIPYAHYKNYLSTVGTTGDPFALLGTVSVVVYNKLRVGEGATKYCTVNIYSRFVNSNFQMLRPPPVVGDASPHFEKHGAMMSISRNVASVVDDVTDAIGKVGSLAEYALDAPNVSINHTAVLPRAAPMLNHATNVHYLNVMDLHPGQRSLADNRDVASPVPECTIKYLMTKMCYLNTFSVNVADLEGTTYMVLPMTPTMKLFNSPINALVDETLMGYVAAPFKFWRGGFRILVEVIATSIHSARLIVATHYGCASSTVTMDNIMSQNAEVLEIGAGRNTFEIVVPWRVSTQWLEVPVGAPENVNAFEPTTAARYSMGEISIRLLTRLQAVPSVADTIDCNVYVSMLDDCALTYLGMNTTDLVPVLVPNQKIVP